MIMARAVKRLLYSMVFTRATSEITDRARHYNTAETSVLKRFGLLSPSSIS